MELLVWIGAAVTLLGLAGIVWSVVKVLAIRREAPPEEELRTRLQKLVPLNLGAFFLSMLGLMCVVVGVILS
ncbi:hypothetical protein AADZ90_008485 [Aestuariibius sp. 2305UL40-4]|uniref:hypothetical protein n=1 Tax=Aestuariibius violaceus TaxID=3234132 RepID=UPI00345EA94D